jgi:DNA mismatch endonuclease (patch repair protein)
MLDQRRRDTALELAYRRTLFAAGLRYRVDHRIAPLRRRADIAFTRWRVAVFLDGCFWHSCPLHATLPKANREWWREKRNRLVQAVLTRSG